MYRIACTLIAVAVLGIACTKETPVEPYDPAHDYFSYANTDQFITRHLELDLTVDFEKEQLRGSAVLHMERLDPLATNVVLDSRGLDISEVSITLGDGDMAAAQFMVGEEDPVLGSAVTITLPEESEAASEITVRIDYATGPNASALQWLPPELTAGGKQPFMFTQSQAIHARSWVPLQDTPAVRITYEATIHTPSNLLALMSANNNPLTPRSGEYEFEMPQPIPSYLLALAVGNMFFAPLGEQTGVYTEPEVLDASAFEFGNLQDMLDTAVEMFGPYQWGRYDLLVLPPSFPYGGMENPRLSFITPSLLAGDHSLVAVIAHELAHSWSGNLVTNGTWRDGWLNEGMTSYLEARLMEVLYGQERVDEENVLGYKELLLNFDRIIPERQALAPPFPSGDPDDFQGTIHYHKGQLLLHYLENGFGRDTFDEFLTGYFSDYAFQTITTEIFLDYLDENLLQAHPGKISREQVEEWLYQPGLPADAPKPHSDSLDRAAALAIAWSQGEVSTDDIPLAKWSPQGAVHFINSLPASLSEEQLIELDNAFGFSGTRNAEIGRTWFIQVAQRQHRPAYDSMEEHLNRYGRTRLVAPVYRALAENGSDLALAEEMFANARAAYHPITIAKIESVMKPKID